MLVGFAAMISITSVIGGVTGAGVLPAANDISQLSAAVSSPYSVSSIETGATRSAVGDVPTGNGQAELVTAGLFGVLSRLNVADVPAFVGSHHAQLDAMLVNPPRASDVTSLWKMLDPQKQASILAAAPHVVGNLEGIPYEVRGRANRLDLTQTITRTRVTLASQPGKAQRLELQRTLNTLNNVKRALGASDGVKRTLIGLDTSSDARAAIVIGDLSSAAYVSYLVPGMYMSVDEQIVDWARTAQELYDTQRSWLQRILGPRGAGGALGVATVAWIGYQTPELMNIGGLDLATAGADNLERSLEGLQSIRQADPPFVSVFAHSYGSTAALLALQRRSVSVDALALLGSPGSDVQSVSGLSVKNGNVFVGQAPMDPIVHSAFFGSDPGAASYGAQKMGVSGGVDPISHEKLVGSSGHNEYFASGSESMRNLALIGIDMGKLVMGGSGSSGSSATTASGR